MPGFPAYGLISPFGGVSESLLIAVSRRVLSIAERRARYFFASLWMFIAIFPPLLKDTQPLSRVELRRKHFRQYDPSPLCALSPPQPVFVTASVFILSPPEPSRLRRLFALEDTPMALSFLATARNCSARPSASPFFRASRLLQVFFAAADQKRSCPCATPCGRTAIPGCARASTSGLRVPVGCVLEKSRGVGRPSPKQ